MQRQGSNLSLFQALLITLTLSLMVLMGLHVFTDRFIITYPTFKLQCIKGWNLGLIDKYDRYSIRIGEPYAFAAHNVPGRAEGAMLGKIFVAGPLDRVEVTDYHELLINNKPYAQGLPHAQTLQVDYSVFFRQSVLDFGRYWGLGDAFLSYDSRYWGSIDEHQVIGRLIRLL